MANDINVNRFVIAVVSIAVSIILIAGVMIPVMNDVTTTDEGEAHTNVSNINDYYIRAEDGKQITLYKKTIDYVKYYSYEDLTQNPDAEKWTMDDSYIVIAGAYFYVYDNADMLFDYINGGEPKTIKYPITINGTTATITMADDSIETYTDVQLITSPQDAATYMAISNDDSNPATIPYVNNSWVGISIDDWTDSPEWVILGFGPADENFDYANNLGYGLGSEIYSNGMFNVSDDGDLENITITYLDTTRTYSITGPEDDYELYYFVPIEVSEGGSGGTAISPTLSSMIWVIPLIMIVGMIIIAIRLFMHGQ